MARGEDAIKGLRPHICSPLGCWNLGGQGSTVSKHKKYYEKCVEKLQIPLEVILSCLKCQSVFLEKSRGIDAKMHPNGHKTVKTFELEDQCAISFSLSTWPEEPREIDFCKQSWFPQNMFSKNDS